MNRPPGVSAISSIRQAVVRFCATFTISVLILVTLEVAWYLRQRLSASQPDPSSRISIYAGQPWADAFWREDRRRRFVYWPYVVWRQASLRGETVVIEPGGERRTFHSHCDGTSYTIWMFGGSTMFGEGSPDWTTIPSLLAERYERDGRPACVHNYGSPGYLSTQELVALVLALKKTWRPPDLVLFYDGVNDVGLSHESGALDVTLDHANVRRAFEDAQAGLQGSFIYLQRANIVQMARAVRGRLNQLAERVRHRGPRHPESDMSRVDALAEAAVDRYIENVKVVEALGHSYGFRYAFFWHPNILVEHKSLTSEEERIRGQFISNRPVMDLYRRSYELAKRMMRPDVFYIADVFNATAGTLYIDAWHVGPEGNRLVANRIYQILQARGW